MFNSPTAAVDPVDVGFGQQGHGIATMTSAQELERMAGKTPNKLRLMLLRPSSSPMQPHVIATPLLISPQATLVSR